MERRQETMRAITQEELVSELALALNDYFVSKAEVLKDRIALRFENGQVFWITVSVAKE